MRTHRAFFVRPVYRAILDAYGLKLHAPRGAYAAPSPIDGQLMVIVHL